MAFPWNVEHAYRKGAWVYSSLLLVLYFCYCILVIVRAYQARTAPPTSVVYDRTAHIAFPDFVVEAPSWDQTTSDKFARCICWNVTSSEAVLFHTDALSKPLSNDAWSSDSGESPIWTGPGDPPFNLTYRDSSSCCQIEYGRNERGKVYYLFKTGPITYVGNYTHGQILTIGFSDAVKENQEGWVLLTGSAQEMQTCKAAASGVSQVILSPLLFNNLGEAPFMYFKAITALAGINLPPETEVNIDMVLDGSGIQIITQRDPVNVADILAKCGGIWFFVPLLFALIYVSSGADIRLTRISVAWAFENLWCCTRSKEREILHHIQLRKAASGEADRDARYETGSN